jgi:hypothetical protein
MKRKGARGGKRTERSRGSDQEARRGYRWVKSWLQAHPDGEAPLGEDAEGELRKALDPEALARWLPRLFWESSETERPAVLRLLVPRAGKKAVPFLNEVVRSPWSRLTDKGLALEQLKAFGETPDPGSEENVERAFAFVERLPGWLREAEPAETIPQNASRAFQELSPPFQGVALRELMNRHPGETLRFLAYALGGRADLWDEVLDMLEEAPQEEAARLLERGYGVADKALQKKIRRVHHKRSVRGLPVFPLEREETEGAIWKPPVPPEPMGLLSMPEPAGSKMVWLIRPNVRKGMLVFCGWVDEERGLMKFFVMDPSRKELEKYKASLLADAELTVVESRPGFCAWLLEEAYQKGPPTDSEEAEAYKAVRPLVKEVAPAEKPRSPVHEVFFDRGVDPVVEDPLGESANLLKEGLMLDWTIEAERIRPHLEQMEDIGRSRIIVHPMQKKERLEAFYRETANRILSDPACRASWRRRLEDAAWVFYKKGLEGQARRLAYMSRYLEDPEKDAARISFFVELVRRGLEEGIQEKKTEERQRPSLIIKPS